MKVYTPIRSVQLDNKVKMEKKLVTSWRGWEKVLIRKETLVDNAAGNEDR